jgi:hypothetical protein
MHKLIHSDFEIDLSNYGLVTIEENHWFSNRFYTKYSYPFVLKFTDEIADTFKYLQSHYAENPDQLYICQYVNGDILETSTLEISEINESISLNLRYGFDEFPNFDKKLSDLDLESFEITTGDIYTHALSIIDQSWPDVNYNFPQIHTDKINTSDSIWTHFGEIINNYSDGDFLINEVIDDITYNRNLMQPLPYYLYLLKRGFELGGFTLHGDILTNPILQKMLMYHESKYYNTNEQQHYYLSVTHDDLLSTDDRVGYFNKTVTILEPGKYHITGNVTIQSRWKRPCWLTIKYRDTVIWSKFIYDDRHHSGYPYFYYIDKEFETIQDELLHTLTVESKQYYMNPMVADIYADSILLYDDDGVAIPNVINLNEINLSKVVPKKTFGDLVTFIKNLFNIDIELKGTEVWMNYIDSQISYTNAFNLQEFEIKHPTRTPNKNTSFLLKYADVDSEEFEFSKMFYNRDGWATDNFVTDDETKNIEINGLPLPLLERHNVQTAYAFESVDTKFYMVLYNGLNNNDLNLTETNAPLLIPSLAPIYWQKWLQFRVTSINYKWVFSCWVEQLTGLKAKGKAFAYGNYHIVKSIEKTELKQDLYKIEIELERLL